MTSFSSPHATAVGSSMMPGAMTQRSSTAAMASITASLSNRRNFPDRTAFIAAMVAEDEDAGHILLWRQMLSAGFALG